MAAPTTDFDVLYSQAIDLAKAFPEFQFKTVTAMLVVLGWMISSETAQLFIRSHAHIALPLGTAAFALLACLKAVWISGHYKRMKAMHERLVQLAPAHALSAESLAQIGFGRVLPVTYAFVNFVLCGAGVTVLALLCS